MALSTRGYTKLRGDIRRTNNYIVTIGGLTNNKGEAIDISTVTTNFTIPSVEVGVITLTHGNDSKTFAGQATWSAGQMVINDTLNRDEADALVNWFKRVYKFNSKGDGVIGFANDVTERDENGNEVVIKGYKVNVRVEEYAGDLKFRRVQTYPMWPSALNWGELDASNAALKQVSLTLQVDPPETIEPTYEDYPE